MVYVNTLEPIVHLLSEDINDVDANGRSVTKVIEERVNPLWNTWRDQVIVINKSLDQVQGSMPVGDEEESADSNAVIAKAALEMFQRAEELEKVRYCAALILIEEYKNDAAAKGASAAPAAKEVCFILSGGIAYALYQFALWFALPHLRIDDAETVGRQEALIYSPEHG